MKTNKELFRAMTLAAFTLTSISNCFADVGSFMLGAALLGGANRAETIIKKEFVAPPSDGFVTCGMHGENLITYHHESGCTVKTTCDVDLFLKVDDECYETTKDYSFKDYAQSYLGREVEISGLGVDEREVKIFYKNVLPIRSVPGFSVYISDKFSWRSTYLFLGIVSLLLIYAIRSMLGELSALLRRRRVEKIERLKANNWRR